MMPLTEAEKKERKRESQRKYRENNKEKKRESDKRYRENNKEKIKETTRLYRENNKEKIKEYNQTPKAKKSTTISRWIKSQGLKESKEDLDRIYELRETQELCNACDCVITRDGNNSSTTACMDHEHYTGRFRHIICQSCNNCDNWKRYFC